MGRARKPVGRKPLAPKDSNIISPQQPQQETQQQQLLQQHRQQEDQQGDVKQQMIEANHREAERRIAAIRAVRDAEVEGYLTQLRVALSMLSKEVRAMPLGEFVIRFCPDRECIRNPDSGILELRPRAQNPNPPDCPSTARHPIASLENLAQPKLLCFPSSAVKEELLHSADKLAQDETEDEEFLKFMESFRSSKFCHSKFTTPSTDGHLMAGVTPKTLRLPKRGEPLLSVNGSPLGVFDEKDGITAIPEERPRRARRRLHTSARISQV